MFVVLFFNNNNNNNNNNNKCFERGGKKREREREREGIEGSGDYQTPMSESYTI